MDSLANDMSDQQKLWHDNVYDALRTAIQWLGGFKAVGSEVWPEKAPDKAGEHLSACCNPERREVLNPEQLILIMRKARQAGCHSIAAFLNEESGYAPPQPVEPQDEVLEVQRAFTRGVSELRELIERAERAQLRLGRDFGLK